MEKRIGNVERKLNVTLICKEPDGFPDYVEIHEIITEKSDTITLFKEVTEKVKIQEFLDRAVITKQRLEAAKKQLKEIPEVIEGLQFGHDNLWPVWEKLMRTKQEIAKKEAKEDKLKNLKVNKISI